MMHQIWAAPTVKKPKRCGVIIEPTFGMIDRIILPAIAEFWPQELIVRISAKDHFMDVRVPSHIPGEDTSIQRIFFCSATHPDHIRGMTNVAWVVIDEAAMMDEMVWTIVRGRVMDIKAPVLITTTPKYDEGALWLKELVDKALDPKHSGDDVPWDRRHFFINWSSFDNPHLPTDEVNLIREFYDGDFFTQEIQGKFVQGGKLIFSALDFQFYNPGTIDHTKLTTYISIDPAYTEEQVDDRSQTSISVIGVSHDRKFYLLENVAGYWDETDQINNIFAFVTVYNPLIVGAEKNAGFMYLNRLIYEHQKETGINFEFVSLPLANKKKLERARVLTPLIKSGKLLIPDTDDGHELIEQLKTFPLGRLTDRVDSLAHCFHKDLGLLEGMFPEKIEEYKPRGVPIISAEEYDIITMPESERQPQWTLN